MRCRNCDAPLTPRASAPVVTCATCGVTVAIGLAGPVRAARRAEAPAPAEPSAPPLPQLTTAWALLSLERHMVWNAVTEGWPKEREQWVQTAMTTHSVAALAKLVLDLEQFTRWESVIEGWTGTRRRAWAESLRAPTREREVALALLQFEGALRWEAVIEAWAKEAPAWIERLRGVT